MSLNQLLEDIEEKIGKFSKYLTKFGPGATLISGESIPLAQKPAQKFLSGLGVQAKELPLSMRPDGQPILQSGNPDQTLIFSENETLKISGKRVDRLLSSAKIYLNRDIISAEMYRTGLSNIEQQDQKAAPNHIHWQNLAVGVCHVQEIDLLISHTLETDKAVAHPRVGAIQEDHPAILLLSSPALNFSYGMANSLSCQAQQDFIRGMFRNLFEAAINEKRNYIALPAAGLGAFGGNSNVYFKRLMEVAKEYPNLNIIYHPAQFSPIFKKYWQRAGSPSNVVEAHKDVVFIADELTQRGYTCALHNPSDADVVYGVYDVGEYWKSGKGSGYVGEEHIGAMTTAPLNSKGLNPNAYERIVECTPKSKTSHALNTADIGLNFSEKTNLNLQELRAITDLIYSLEKEINSIWPYPNKKLKEVKTTALKELIELSQEHSVELAAEIVKEMFPTMCDGSISTRTADLMDDLVTGRLRNNPILP